MAEVPSHVCIGVGTVMDDDVAQLKVIAAMGKSTYQSLCRYSASAAVSMDRVWSDSVSLGAKFALSPIEPQGFIKACHSSGILAVPAGELCGIKHLADKETLRTQQSCFLQECLQMNYGTCIAAVQS